jgi:pyrroloquinoline-quinone synthase
LVEKYGFSEKDVTFFRLHIGADEEHGERGFEIVEKYAATAEQQANCLRIVREATLMRGLYLDGLYQKYLAPEAARMAAE